MIKELIGENIFYLNINLINYTKKKCVNKVFIEKDIFLAFTIGDINLQKMICFDCKMNKKLKSIA